MAKSYSGKIYGDADKENILSIINTTALKVKGLMEQISTQPRAQEYLHCQRHCLRPAKASQQDRAEGKKDRPAQADLEHVLASYTNAFHRDPYDGTSRVTAGLSDEVIGRRVC